MVIFRKYKWIVYDINDIDYHREFDEVLTAEMWMHSDKNDDRNMDMVTPQEYQFLLKIRDGEVNNTQQKQNKVKRTKIRYEDND